MARAVLGRSAAARGKDGALNKKQIGAQVNRILATQFRSRAGVHQRCMAVFMEIICEFVATIMAFTFAVTVSTTVSPAQDPPSVGILVMNLCIQLFTESLANVGTLYAEGAHKGGKGLPLFRAWLGRPKDFEFRGFVALASQLLIFLYVLQLFCPMRREAGGTTLWCFC